MSIAEVRRGYKEENIESLLSRTQIYVRKSGVDRVRPVIPVSHRSRLVCAVCSGCDKHFGPVEESQSVVLPPRNSAVSLGEKSRIQRQVKHPGRNRRLAERFRGKAAQQQAVRACRCFVEAGDSEPVLGNRKAFRRRAGRTFRPGQGHE